MIRGSSEYMCKITVSYDSAKRDEVKKILKKEGMTIQDAMRLYLDIIVDDDMPDTVREYFIKKKVETDPEDAVYHFDNVNDAIKFMDYATR